MHSGHLTCSCNVLSKMLTGLSSVRMNAQVFKTHMELNSKNCLNPMKHKDWLVKQCLLVLFGTSWLNHKLKQEPHTCCIRMQQMKSRTKRIWEQFGHRTCVLKLWNTQQKMRLRCATSHRLHSTNMLMQKINHSIINSCMMSLTMQLVI